VDGIETSSVQLDASPQNLYRSVSRFLPLVAAKHQKSLEQIHPEFEKSS
jgi:hypothetical protein